MMTRQATLRHAAVFAAAMIMAGLLGCSKKSAANGTSIAVFIPGIMADSPIYANLAQGVRAAAQQHNENAGGTNAAVYVMEAGTNQAEWATKLTALAATGTYDVIISSNPSLPEIAEPISRQFPGQRFIFLDAAAEGNGNMYCVSYNQKEQAYLSGYIAGLFSTTHKTALVAAQEYPVMNNVLYPYFARGATDAASGTTCEFSVVGNWYDAAKGAELTDALCALGVDVILPICGGASQGVIASAQEHGIHLAWFDENGFGKAAGTIISSCMARQEKAAQETTAQYLSGGIPWGTTRTVGFAEGYIEFITDDPLYQQTVPQDIRDTMDALIADLQSGARTVPGL